MPAKVKNISGNMLLFITMYAALFCALFFAPYVTDDHLEKIAALNFATWMDCFKGAVFYGNGRILGNFGLLSCLKSEAVRAFLKPLIVTTAVFCVNYLFNIKTLYGRIMTALLMIIPARGFFSYCFIKNPMFYNYVAPITFFLLCLSLLKYSKETGRLKMIMLPAALILSVAMQLFSENSTVIFTIAVVLICAYELVTYKKISVHSVVTAIGSVVGLAVILFLVRFLTSHNYAMLHDMSEYRTVVFSVFNIIGVLVSFSEMFSSCVVLIAFLSAIQIFLVVKESPDDKLKKWHIAIPAAYTFISLFYAFIQSEERKVIVVLQVFFLGVFLVFLANTVVIVFRFIKSEKDKMIISFIMILAVMSVGMFSIINQHGYRTFYLSIFLVLMAGYYILLIIKREYNFEETIKKAEPVLNRTMVTLALCLTVMVSVMMMQNYSVVLMRDKYIAEKVSQGESVIQVPKLPNGNLCREEFMMGYDSYIKQLHGDIQLVYIDIEQWELYYPYVELEGNPIAVLTYVINNYNFNNIIR